MKTKAALKSIFSSANLLGIGATALSLGFGSEIGAGIFAAAAVVGTVNKYRSLTDKPRPQGRVGQILTDPGFTSTVLMIGAGVNMVDQGLQTGFNAASRQYDAALYHGLHTLGWALGVAGDYVMRRIDRINFKAAGHRAQSSFNAVKETVLSTPVLFYNAVNIAFTTALLSSQRPFDLTSPDSLIGLTTNAVIASGIAYAGYKGYDMIRQGRAPSEAHDGWLNASSFFGTLGLGTMATLNEHYYAAFAQMCFGGFAIKNFFEARAAQKTIEQDSAIRP